MTTIRFVAFLSQTQRANSRCRNCFNGWPFLKGSFRLTRIALQVAGVAYLWELEGGA